LRYLLDASTLLPLLLDYGEKLLAITTRVELFILDLTLYEVGNSLWKLVALLNTLELKDAEDIVYVLKSMLSRGMLKVVEYSKLDPQRILELAVNEKLTFYDASYIAASETIKAVLATEDTELREKARKYISVIGYKEFREKLAE
jgi:predicted nucleic acid-binding protein